MRQPNLLRFRSPASHGPLPNEFEKLLNVAAGQLSSLREEPLSWAVPDEEIRHGDVEGHWVRLSPVAWRLLWSCRALLWCRLNQNPQSPQPRARGRVPQHSGKMRLC